MVNKTNAIGINSDVIYVDTLGVEWVSSNTSPALRRIDENAYPFSMGLFGGSTWFQLHPTYSNMRRCNVADNGTVNAYHGDAAFAYDGSNGQVMVRVPKFWYKSYNSGTTFRWWISPVAKSGFSVHPAFIRDGVEHDEFYFSAFEGCAYDVSGSAYITNDGAVDFATTTGDKLSSIAAAKPMSGKNNVAFYIANARVIAQNRGSGWEQQTFNMTCAIQLLYLIEYANYDSQTMIGRGVVDITDDGSTNMSVNTGFTAGSGAGGVDLGNDTGSNSTSKSISYRGIENFWGNIWGFVDGINVKADYNPWIADYDYVSDTFTGPYVDTGLTLVNGDGYVSNIAYGAGCNYGWLPSAVSGSSSTYLCDQYYRAAGNKIALFGGYWSVVLGGGAFCWYVNCVSSIVDRTIGARLTFIA
jgi:hypothetical protein